MDIIEKDGKRYMKCLIIDDSWGHDSSTIDGQRIITEDYLKARCTGAMYLLPNISFKFDTVMKYGDTGTQVQKLQDFLKSKGFLSNTIPSTGKFLNMTAHAVQKWQIVNNINDFLNKPFQSVVFGPKSIALANSQL